MNNPTYDDGDWTEDEMSALAAQMFTMLDDPEKIERIEDEKCLPYFAAARIGFTSMPAIETNRPMCMSNVMTTKRSFGSILFVCREVMDFRPTRSTQSRN